MKVFENRHNLVNIMSTFFAKAKGVGLDAIERAERRKLRRKERAVSRYNRHANYRSNGDRQMKRYAKNRMDEQQRNSHKPGTVQPKHIFGSP